jgi:hypothetical protein
MGKVDKKFMENKKQLIIIPPMSEPVKKLHEVLEGIAGDENIEISMIDDLKELSQFVSTTGQCLVIASNAKKCATFLQENKSFLLKNHVKTILFTPKEIPAKTLIKFTKVGLTESVLESLPPKTFLYKVKLLLRSIKTAKPQEDAEKVVKSLEAQKAMGLDANSEVEIKDKENAEENVIDLERPGKNKKNNQDDENVIDYGNPLKGKIKPQEDVIDTHWKSNRKTDQEDAAIEEENSSVASLEDENNIDMYYRGKQSKNNMIEPEAEEDSKPLVNLYETAEEEEKKKKSNYQDVIDEGSMKQKKLKVEEDLEEIPLFNRKKEDLVVEEIDMRKKKEDVPLEQAENFLKKKIQLDEAVEPEKKPHEGQVDDLGGHYKGKITRQEEMSEPEMEEEDKEYDNSDLYEKEKKPSLDLDIEAAKKKKNGFNEEIEEETNPHEGEVDHIDNNMMGDASTVDKIKNLMEGRSSGNQDEHNKDETHYLDPVTKKLVETDDEDLEREKLEAVEKESKDRKLEKLEKVEAETGAKKEKLDIEASTEDFRKNKLDNLDVVDDNMRGRQALDPKLEDDRDHQREGRNQEEEDNNRRPLEGSQMPEQKNRDPNSHAANVDKIDTFYRGSDSKKKNHSWDNLVDKNNTLELTPGKGKRQGDGNGNGNGGNDLGEQTIDYRKLKEEFDQIAMSENSPLANKNKERVQLGLNNDDDLGSFKVIEANPVSMDFAINIINSIYTKDLKPKQMYQQLALEILEQHHAIVVFYSYKLSDKKFTEVFNSFSEFTNEKIDPLKKEWWFEKKKDNTIFEHYQSKTMSTWRCPEIIKADVIWEDVELPLWAEQELQTKAVELIFPYFDGIDRMGMALVFFPDGINPKTSHSLLTLLEMARTLLLDTIERYKVVPIQDNRLDPETKNAPAPEEAATEKKGVIGFLGGLFGRKKAG